MYQYQEIVMHFPVNLKNKMADESLRGSNEIGLYNFLVDWYSEYVRTSVSVDYYEETNLSLEDAILTFQLSDDSILQDFKTIIEAVLTNVRLSCNEKI